VRWRLKLAEYEYEVVYKASKTNLNANALFRNPVPGSTLPIKKGSTQKANPLRDTHISARGWPPFGHELLIALEQ